VVIKE